MWLIAKVADDHADDQLVARGRLLLTAEFASKFVRPFRF
jgi:hypothetical protein